MTTLIDPRGALAPAAGDIQGVSADLVRRVRELAQERDDLDDDDVIMALELTRWETKKLTQSQRDALFLLAVTLLHARARGSTSLSLDDRPAFAVFATDEQIKDIDRLAAPRQAPAVIGRVGSHRPIIVDGSHVYVGKLRQCEDTIVERIQSLGAAKHDAAWCTKAKKVLKAVRDLGGGRKLTAEQEKAVASAVTSRVTAITGGPGTGKTTIVFCILRALLRLGVPSSEIAMATPTGKAGNRMAQALRNAAAALGSADPDDAVGAVADPLTIHRLLRDFGDGIFRHHAGSRLPAKWLIVDEGSMIDSILLAKLLGAVRDDATLIILGDAGQLPAVREGATFRDIVEAGGAAGDGCAVVRLTESLRARASNSNGRNILGVAANVLAGASEALFDKARSSEVIEPVAPQGPLPFAGIKIVDIGGDDGAMRKLLAMWYAEFGKAMTDLARKTFHVSGTSFDAAELPEVAELFKALHLSRILCPGNHGSRGISGINEVVRELAVATSSGGRGRWYAGAPIMMTCNNYTRNVYNGDMGLVLSVAVDGAAPRLLAVFERSLRHAICSLEELQDDLVLGYATTVHKAQGGEHAHVALILPVEDSRQCSRELIYTALTRASQSVTIIGAPSVLQAGVDRKIVRTTRLAERLGK